MQTKLTECEICGETKPCLYLRDPDQPEHHEEHKWWCEDCWEMESKADSQTSPFEDLR